MERKKRIPKRRFREFLEAGEWKETPLSSFATFKKGVGYTKEDLQRKGTPIILYGRLYTNYESVIESVDDYVNPIARSLYSTGHEIIVPASGETAEDIAVASAVRTPGFILGGDLNVIYPNEKAASTISRRRSWPITATGSREAVFPRSIHGAFSRRKP